MDNDTRFNRQPNGTFGPANLANPGGRPQGLAKAVRERTNSGLDLVEVLLSIAKDETARARDRIAAAEVLLDRAFGKAVQSLELGGQDGQPVRLDIRQLTDCELNVLMGVLARQPKQPA